MRVEDVPIDEPCRVSREQWTPNAKGSYCQHCRKQVHDLSSMTAEAAAIFFELNAEREICVSYLMDSNGNLAHAAAPPRSLLRPRPVHTLAAATLAAACNAQPAEGILSGETSSAQAALEAAGTPSKECDSPADSSPSPLPSTAASAPLQNPVSENPPELRRTAGLPRRRYPNPQLCDPPWYLGADGVRRPRPECLR